MTTRYHTPIAFKAAANAAIINSPLGQLDEAIAAAFMGLENKLLGAASTANISNAFNGWWNVPTAICVGTNTYIGAIQANGLQKVVRVDESGTVTEYSIGTTIDDDHNIPAFYAASGVPPIVFYHAHNFANYVYFKIGTAPSDDWSSLTSEQTIDYGIGATYAQVWRDAVSGDFVLFSRIDADFWWVTTSDDYGSTWSTPVSVFRFGNGNKGYIHTALRDDNKLNVAIYGHPTTSNLNNLYYAEIDLETGQVDTLTSTNVANIYTEVGLPITVENDLDLIYDPPSGSTMRLNGISGATPHGAISFIEWTNDDDAEYKILTWDGEAYSSHDMVATGVVFGYLPSVHYHGGTAFPSPVAADEIVLYVAREDDGTWYLERWKSRDNGVNWETYTVETSTSVMLVRPVCPVNASKWDVAYCRLSSYGDGFSNFVSDMRVADVPGE